MNQNGKTAEPVQPIEDQVASMLDEFIKGAADLPQVPEDLGGRGQQPEEPTQNEPGDSESRQTSQPAQPEEPENQHDDEAVDEPPVGDTEEPAIPAVVDELKNELEELRNQNQMLLAKLDAIVTQKQEAPTPPPSIDSLTVVPADADINEVLTPEGLNEFATKVANATYQKAVATAVSQVAKAIPRYVGMMLTTDRFLQKNPDIRAVKDYFMQQVVEAQKTAPGVAFEKILQTAANRTRKALNLRPSKPRKPASPTKPPARQPEEPPKQEDPFQAEVDQMLKALV